MSGDKSTYNFSKLPDPEGTGRLYRVSVVVAATAATGREATSEEASAAFATLPLRPSNLRPGARHPAEVAWTRSWSPAVRRYRITWRSSEEGSKVGGEGFVEHDPRAEEHRFRLTGLEEEEEEEEEEKEQEEVAEAGAGDGAAERHYYKVNVYAVSEPGEGAPAVESRELHEKFVFRRGEEEEKEEGRGERRLALYVPAQAGEAD